mmetsp:Transcript_9982/g.29489  ORF Transcript_9982/g.29489 Transcript_9982/m.29489 type:complete len:216 (+) Transcript_9982:93-740(+)
MLETNPLFSNILTMLDAGEVQGMTPQGMDLDRNEEDSVQMPTGYRCLGSEEKSGAGPCVDEDEFSLHSPVWRRRVIMRIAPSSDEESSDIVDDPCFRGARPQKGVPSHAKATQSDNVKKVTSAPKQASSSLVPAATSEATIGPSVVSTANGILRLVMALGALAYSWIREVHLLHCASGAVTPALEDSRRPAATTVTAWLSRSVVTQSYGIRAPYL